MSYFNQAFASVNVPEIQKSLENSGWAIFPELVPKPELDELRTSIDELALMPSAEVNYGGSEHRIWKAHEKSSIINDFCKFSDQVISSIEGEPRAAIDILAIRNLTLDTKKIELGKGRWHLDSFRQQLKVFVFISDVSPKSGAFEMIPQTHATSFKIKQALKGNLISPTDLIAGTRSYSKVKEDVIEKILAKGYETKIFDVAPGTIALVDTSCVHRARPCTNGSRYALTSYYA